MLHLCRKPEPSCGYGTKCRHLKEAFTREILDILPLEAVNMARPCFHCLAERTIWPEVLSREADKVSHDLEELLGCVDNMDPLVQEIPGFLPGEPVLNHGEENLYPHCALFRVRWTIQ